MTSTVKPLAITLLLVAIDSGCAGTQSQSSQPAAARSSPRPASAAPTTKDGIYRGKGKVTKINEQAPSIELNHEDIPGLMPAMVMEFYVSDKSLLDKIKLGDTVNFQIEYKGGMEKIIALEKAK